MLPIEQIPIASFIVDTNALFIQINEAAEQLTGYLSKELLGQKLEFLICDKEIQELIGHQNSSTISLNEIITRKNIVFNTKYGQELSVDLRISGLETFYLVMIYKSSDILVNQYQSELNNTHKIFSAMNLPYWEWDVEQGMLYCSADLMSMMGNKHEVFSGSKALVEKHVDEHILQDLYFQIEEHLKGVVPNINITYPFKTKQGEEKWLTIIGKKVDYHDNRAHHIVGTAKDVTDSRVMIKQLKKQNDLLMLAERINNSGHWRYELASGDVFWSSEMYRIYGVNPKKFTPTLATIINFAGVDLERENIRENFNNAITEIKGYYNKSTIVHPKGHKIKIETIGELELNNEGNIIAVFGICRDITKSEEVFEKLKLLAMVNHTIKVPIFFIDDEDNVVYQDLSPQNIGKNTVLFNYINFSITEYLHFKKQAKLNGQMKENNASFDKYNSVFDISVTYEEVEGIYIWIVENVTDKFRKEQQQVISNRLALLGNTFGNVSHDINNVLGVALGAIEMLEIKFAKGDDIATYIVRVKNAIDKGKNVTERLLAFTRIPTIKVVSFDPLDEIKDNQFLFKQLLLSTINLTFKFDKFHCLINFPQGEFINMLLNLVLNAQDAIQGKGVSGQIEISANLGEKNRLEIHVKDSGVGIKKENLTRIFDPFYSSKSVNKGNGIGLANVYSTMYKHNGHIEVEGSCELGGAHFTLVFKCKELDDQFKTPIVQPPSLNMKNKRILVLDDEESIAEFVGLYLENIGAEVTTVSTKHDLLDVISKHDYFDIFITDMIMPDLTGREAVNLVLEKYPKITIYSISGYIAIEDRSWEYPVLRKPFNSKELALFLSRE